MLKNKMSEKTIIKITKVKKQEIERIKKEMNRLS